MLVLRKMGTFVRSPRRALWLCGLLAPLLLWPSVSCGQTAEPNALSLSGGAAVRGSGRIAECCGPYVGELDRATSWWVALRGGRRVAPRIGVDVEVSWAQQPDYVAYFQDDIAGPAPGYRAYQATNSLRALALDGRVRVSLWSAGRTTVGLSGGIGLLLEMRQSHLVSTEFRPRPWTDPVVEFDHTDRRARMSLGGGIEVATPAFGGPLDVLVELGIRRNLGGSEPSRSDLDLGRTAIRAGLGLRARF